MFVSAFCVCVSWEMFKGAEKGKGKGKGKGDGGKKGFWGGKGKGKGEMEDAFKRMRDMVSAITWVFGDTHEGDAGVTHRGKKRRRKRGKRGRRQRRSEGAGGGALADVTETAPYLPKQDENDIDWGDDRVSIEGTEELREQLEERSRSDAGLRRCFFLLPPQRYFFSLFCQTFWFYDCCGLEKKKGRRKNSGRNLLLGKHASSGGASSIPSV